MATIHDVRAVTEARLRDNFTPEQAEAFRHLIRETGGSFRESFDFPGLMLVTRRGEHFLIRPDGSVVGDLQR